MHPCHLNETTDNARGYVRSSEKQPNTVSQSVHHKHVRDTAYLHLSDKLLSALCAFPCLPRGCAGTRYAPYECPIDACTGLPLTMKRRTQPPCPVEPRAHRFLGASNALFKCLQATIDSGIIPILRPRSSIFPLHPSQQNTDGFRLCLFCVRPHCCEGIRATRPARFLAEWDSPSRRPFWCRSHPTPANFADRAEGNRFSSQTIKSADSRPALLSLSVVRAV